MAYDKPAQIKYLLDNAGMDCKSAKLLMRYGGVKDGHTIRAGYFCSNAVSKWMKAISIYKIGTCENTSNIEELIRCLDKLGVEIASVYRDFCSDLTSWFEEYAYNFESTVNEELLKRFLAIIDHDLTNTYKILGIK
jgi:HEPN domain-containing protein